MSLVHLHQRNQLLSRCSSSTGTSRLDVVFQARCSHVRPVHTLMARNVCCGAGKRPGGLAGRSNSAGQQQRSSKRPQEDGSSNVYQPGPIQQGSALQKTITSSIKQISNDSQAGLQELEDIVDQWGSSFNYIHASAAIVKAGNIKRVQPAAATGLLDRLASIWDCLLPGADAQGMANVLWACGKLRYSNAHLWSSTLEAFLQRHDQHDENAPQHIANLLHGLANAAVANNGKVPGISRGVVEAAVCQLLQHMRVRVTHPLLVGVQPQCISNTLWACAKLRINPGDTALNSLLQATSRLAMLEAAIPQQMSNSLWAASELWQHCGWQPQVDPRVWQRLLGEQQLRRIADSGKPRDVAEYALALARLSLPAVSAESTAGIVDSGFAQQCVVQVLQGKVAKCIEVWDAADICITMWACGKLHMFDAVFFDRAAAAAPGWLRGAIQLNLVQVAYACRVLQYKHQQLMAGIVARSKQVQHKHKAGATRQKQQDMQLATVIGDTVVSLDMQQLAGDVRDLVAGSGVTGNSRLGPADSGMLWGVHAWLVQHQLLGGQGLVGLLSEQQLAQGREAAEAHRAQERQHNLAASQAPA